MNGRTASASAMTVSARAARPSAATHARRIPPAAVRDGIRTGTPGLPQSLVVAHLPHVEPALAGEGLELVRPHARGLLDANDAATARAGEAVPRLWRFRRRGVHVVGGATPDAARAVRFAVDV